MDEQILIQVLEAACPDSRLVFQVAEQDGQLHIFVNRPPELALEYRGLAEQIYTALDQLTLRGVGSICLYSRPLGEAEPDWEGEFQLSEQAQVRNRVRNQVRNRVRNQVNDRVDEAGAIAVSAPPHEARTPRVSVTPESPIPESPISESAVSELAVSASVLTEAVAASVPESPNPPPQQESGPATPEEKEFDLASHCFIRNRRLLSASLVPPSKAVARQIDTFHQWGLADQQRMMPQLELFFKGASNFCSDELPEAMRQWFHDTEALGDEELRKTSIWLSRYCADPTATLATIARVFDPTLDWPATPSDGASPEHDSGSAERPGAPSDALAPTCAGDGATEVAPGIAPGAVPAQLSQAQPSRTQPSRTQRRSRPWFKASPLEWLFPSLIILGSGVLIALGMGLAQPRFVGADVCQASPEPAKCQLATQVMFEAKAWEAMQDKVVPMPINPEALEMAEGNAIAGCEPQAAMNAGYNALQAFQYEVTPLKVNRSEILPGIFLVDIAHQQNKGSGQVRTACLLSNEPIPRHHNGSQPMLRASAVIPPDWPVVPYDNRSAVAATRQALQMVHPLVSFGSMVLFTIAGLFMTAMLGLAVRVYSISALSRASLVMALFEALFDLMLPLGGLLLFPVMLAQKSLALGLTAAVVPKFWLDWSDGYPSVVACVALMTFVRFVLRWALLLVLMGGGVGVWLTPAYT